VDLKRKKRHDGGEGQPPIMKSKSVERGRWKDESRQKTGRRTQSGYIKTKHAKPSKGGGRRGCLTKGAKQFKVEKKTVNKEKVRVR